jgi:two-component system, NarL family, nitrate/nitrite response regulator NarL
MKHKENKIRILIADDHQMMLDGLRSVLSGESDIVIVAEAKNGVEVLDKIHFDEIDVAVIDIAMPEMDGHETVLKMKQSHPHIKVLVLSFHKDEAMVGNLLRAGVDGYVIKERGSEELVKAIRSLALGIEYFDTEVNKISRRSMQQKDAGNKAVQFTAREMDVLKLLAQSLSSKEIGDKLFISESTVETHKKNLIQKLNLPSARHLRTYAVEHYKHSK